MEPLRDDGAQRVHRDGNPELGLHRIRGRAGEGLDPQRLGEPLEDQRDRPPARGHLGNDQGRQGEVGGEIDEPPAMRRVEGADPTEPVGIALVAGEAVEPEGLIGATPGARSTDREARYRNRKFRLVRGTKKAGARWRRDRRVKAR